MTMSKLTWAYIGLAALLLAATPAGAQLYKWVDENGVTNYSSEPPPKSRTRKPATIVEDTISVYTPEKAVTDEMERRAQQKPAPPSPPVASVPPPPQAARTPAPPIPYDPCMTADDPNCRTLIYDSSPVFSGRRSPVPLHQPQLPPGTIAGQSTTQGSYIPGQSGSAPPPASQTSRPAGQPSASFTLKPAPRDPNRDRDSSR
jgi:hypothetical protein